MRGDGLASEDRLIERILTARLLRCPAFHLGWIAVLVSFGWVVFARFLPPPRPAPTGYALATIGTLLVFAPAVLKHSLSSSRTVEGGWVFFATPTDRGHLALAMRRVVAIRFLLPALLLLEMGAVLFSGRGIYWISAFSLFGGLSWLCLQVLFLCDPAIPFAGSRRVGKAQLSRTFPEAVAMVLAPFAVGFGGPPLDRLCRQDASVVMAGAAILVAIAVGLEFPIRRAIPRKVESLEFAG
ncbi:MAG TPA: hypothetical protein VFI25_20210 [Planctomycetota bacterium]|nr:hypothetical protein [Planctomycetota bacterium]